MKLMTVNDRIKVLTEMEKLPKSYKLSVLYQDDFEVPIYNIWTFNKILKIQNPEPCIPKFQSKHSGIIT